VSLVSAVVDRFYAAFNERDLDTWAGLLDDDVLITVDAARFQGREAARAYAEGSMRAYPGVVAADRRVVAESGDTVVSEFRLLNPAAAVVAPDGSPAEAWRLDGLLCEVVRLRDDRIVSVRSYYAATDTDRTDVAQVPSRAEAARIAQEQAALRQVATLVARGVSQDELFAAVNGDIARLVDADITSLFRFEPDDTMTLLAAWGGTTVPPAVGERRALDAELRAVRDTGRPTRFEAAELPATGPFVDEARGLGIASSVGVPIVVDGRVWGVSFAASFRPEPFAADTESRIAGFTDLVGTALANAQARAELQALADQQAALRRVAELVARGPALDEVFTAVAVEASALLGGAAAALQRYDSDDVGVVVAACNSPAPLGLRVPARAGTGTGDVRRTGRPARTDAYEGTALADLARRFGVVAAVVVPVIVEGRVWGNLSTSSSGPPIPSGTEDRLMPFAELAGVAIANAENRAKLTASRARVVATADETRRRLQRDVHDSAQQRLVHTVITLKLARNAIAAGDGAVELVDEALRNAERASSELRDVVRGILPAALIRGGLRTGLESLVEDLAVDVDVRVDAPRLPVHLETTAYFIVAESLTNVVKHARATRATVDVDLRAGSLLIDVRDDGVGGADPARGTGLVGLLDRVEAADGALTVVSPAGHGTTVHAELPLHHPQS
jgi:signal transduction histidine kinase/ketosteroid isomerase-like protein